MIVRRITGQGFMSYAQGFDVSLPARGVVLVTGYNGAGKSSLAEAVSVAVWGKSLRGRKPWRRGEAGTVSVWSEDVSVTRERTEKDKPALSAMARKVDPGPNGYAWDPFTHDTPTKMQLAIEAVVGDHDTWRRTHVLSSADAAHFTTAADAERKRLLERVFGLERFDVALAACRAELKTAARAHDDAKRELDMQRVRAEEQTLRRARAKAELDGLVKPEHAAEVCTRQLLKLDVSIRNVDVGVAQLRDKDRKMFALVERAQSASRAAAADLAKLLRGDCPVCAQPFPPARVAAAHAEANRASAAALAAETSTNYESAQVTRELAELTGEREELSARRSEWMLHLRDAEVHAVQRQRCEVVLAEAVDDQRVVDERLEELSDKVLDAAAAVAELEACERVLSLTGVRAKILTDALAGIEQAAARWLWQIAGPGMRLELKPYTEQASGAVRDAISIEVHGAGGGEGYGATSGGERRRLDVAILLALAEVASAAAGVQSGTLWLDEVFDALDADGVAAVCEAIRQIAANRPVVVISHRVEAAELLQPVQHLRVEAGKVTS
jgi:DNA repair exonuclease SbcCD ATPase subunit